MGSGMGMPSIGIYSYELYNEYDVDTIIRIGSAGSYCDKLRVFDVMLADSAYSESSFAKVQGGYEDDITYPTESLNMDIMNIAKELGKTIKIGRVHSSDVFYRQDKSPYYKDLYEKKQCLCVEMESFALFHNARILGKNAACLLTISDSFVSNEITTSKQRQQSFTEMMEIALETAIRR